MKTKKILALLLALVLVCSTALVACGEKAEAEKPATTENSDAVVQQDEDTITTAAAEEVTEETQMDEVQIVDYNLGTEPQTLDIARGTDMYSSQVLVETTEGLTRVLQDENGVDKITPAGAESWEVSEDGLVWTFHLRDYNWEDGKAVTAMDFEYGVKRVLKPETASQYAFLLYPILNAQEYNTGDAEADAVGVKALDEKTLQFTLAAPCAYFEALSAFKTTYPQREDVVEEHGEKWGSEADLTLSCGPFKVTEWVHDNMIVLEKNPAYWDADSVILEKINMHIIKDQDASYNSLFNGSIDLGGVSKPEWVQKFNETGDYYLIKGYTAGTNYSIFNTQDPLFSNVKVRQAFSLAIQRQEIADVIFNGIFEPAYGWVSPALACQGTEYRAAAGNPLEKLAEQYPDPKALLIEGLKELGMDEDPSKITVTYLNSGTTQWSRTYTEFLQQMYQQALGINLEGEYVEWGVYSQRVENLEFQMGGAAWTGDYNDPMTFLDLFVSGTGIIPTGWESAEYDALIKEVQGSMDKDVRIENFKKAEQMVIVDEAIVAPTVYRKRNTFVRNYVKNMMIPLFGGGVEFKYAYMDGKTK
jgi:oligopeptide transport system substrate-binding protein